MNFTLQASPAFRRGVLIASLGVAVVEIGLFVMLWRIGSLVDPGADRRAALAVCRAGFGGDATGDGRCGRRVGGRRDVAHGVARRMSRESPSSIRGGAGTASGPTSAHAWQQKGWLVLQVRGHWRRWYVRVGGEQSDARARARRITAGAWLEGSSQAPHLARTTLPIVLATTGVAGLILLWALSALDL